MEIIAATDHSGAVVAPDSEALGASAGDSLEMTPAGTQRLRAHAFYFRDGLPITSFHFSKRLGGT